MLWRGAVDYDLWLCTETQIPGMMIKAAWCLGDNSFRGSSGPLDPALMERNRWRRSDEQDQGTALALRSMWSRPGGAARGARWRAPGWSRGSGHHLLHGLHVSVDRHQRLVGERTR